MSLLIDGYNLLHASGVLARGVGPGSLERSRAALLNFLVASLSPAETARTIIVFDAGQSATGRVRRFEHSGLQVQFSAGKADADDLIEELIRADSAPRSLIVVSSDHRVQRAALRRRAQAIDSDKWIAALYRARSERRDARPAGSAKPKDGLSEVEVRLWLKRFGLDEPSGFGEPEHPTTDSKARQPVAPNSPAPPSEPASTKRVEAPSSKAAVEPPGEPRSRRKLGSSRHREIPSSDSKDLAGSNPFPPGYAEDLTEDQTGD